MTAKFKIGDKVNAYFPDRPENNIENETILSATHKHIYGWLYKVTNQPEHVLFYKECKLQKVAPKLTNEQIFVIFLKESGSYEVYKNNLLHFVDTCHIEEPINNGMYWHCTKEGISYWLALDSKWRALCTRFKLKGDIDLRII